MMALPLRADRLCLAKFVVLLCLTAVQILMTAGIYFISAAIASQTQNYAFMLSPLIVFKEAGLMYLASIPMISFFWLLSTCIRTPIFSVGIGLASIVPSVLMINTKAWFAYPICYPFYIITSEYSKMAPNMSFAPIKLIPWLPTALILTLLCLVISCLYFGQSERR